MVKQVTIEESGFREFPFNLDAGTMNVSGIIGWQAALKFINELEVEKELLRIKNLTLYVTDKINALEGVSTIGLPQSGIISFAAENIHPHDIGSILDDEGVAIRAGHHCTQPVMEHFGIAATTRASFSVYNTRDDVDTLAAAITRAKEIFGT